MLETPRERVNLLKTGKTGDTIEKLYIKYNKLKIINIPVLFEPFENFSCRMRNFFRPLLLKAERAGRNDSTTDLFLKYTPSSTTCFCHAVPQSCISMPEVLRSKKILQAGRRFAHFVEVQDSGM